MGTWVTVNFNKQSGSGGTSVAYANRSSGYVNYWASQKSTSTTYRITSITVPTRSGYEFGGYYTGTGGSGDRIVNSSGVLGTYIPDVTETTVYARWRDGYVITLNMAGGSGGTNRVYSKLGGGIYADASYTTPITSITPPTRGSQRFCGYFYGGVKYIDESGNMSAAMQGALHQDYTLTAQWGSFGEVTDYFNLGSALLIPESSDSGEYKEHVCAVNDNTVAGVTKYGWYSSGVTADSGVWLNPTVVYRVVGDTTVATNLGKAFAASTGVSGYMITSVTIETSLGEFPRVTVKGTANEGADAINLFPVSVSVLARARSQNLLSAINTTATLNSLSLTASCDPVVVSENMMPCASDVVNGRIEVGASVGVYEGEAEPTAGTGFTLVGKPIKRGGTTWPTYDLNLIKEIV